MTDRKLTDILETTEFSVHPISPNQKPLEWFSVWVKLDDKTINVDIQANGIVDCIGKAHNFYDTERVLISLP